MSKDNRDNLTFDVVFHIRRKFRTGTGVYLFWRDRKAGKYYLVNKLYEGTYGATITLVYDSTNEEILVNRDEKNFYIRELGAMSDETELYVYAQEEWKKFMSHESPKTKAQTNFEELMEAVNEEIEASQQPDWLQELGEHKVSWDLSTFQDVLAAEEQEEIDRQSLDWLDELDEEKNDE